MTFAAHASLKPVASLEVAKHKKQNISNIGELERNNLNKLDQEALYNFLEERFSKVAVSRLDSNDGTNGSGMLSVVPSEEALIEKNKAQKTIFEKMYEQAVDRVSQSSQNNTPTTTQKVAKYLQAEEVSPDFNVINIKLPISNTPVLVPALPHIPYFFTNIEILSNGLVLVEENFITLFNGGSPYTRNIAKYLETREGGAKKIGLEIIEASINGKPVEYKKFEFLDRIYMAPKENIILASGVYEYKLKYVLDRQLAYYKDFDELYLDVFGKNSLFISRAGANVVFPTNQKPLGFNAYAGSSNSLQSDNVAIFNQRENILGFVSNVALAPNDSMHLIISIPKNNLTAIDFNKKLWWFIADYGDILFAFLAFVAIFLAYLLSWFGLGKRAAKQKLSFKRTAPLMRYLDKDVCDEVSFGAFLLEMFRRNIIDIQQNDNTILLIKKTDDVSNLARYEQKTLSALFVNKESVLSMTNYNVLKIKRAFDCLRIGIVNTLLFFAYKLNARYLAFSFAMLIFTQIAISSQYINSLQIFMISIIGDILFTTLIWGLLKSIKQPILNIIIKIIFAIGLLLSFVLFSVFINKIAVLFILLSIITIFIFSKLFVKRSGLLQGFIKEVGEYQTYLLNNQTSIAFGREFMVQQANIFALELSDNFVINDNIRDFYKLDLVVQIIKLLTIRK